MATDSSVLAWKIPWTEEPGRLQSMGSRRVRHDWTSLSLFFSCTGEGNGNPLQYSRLENPMDGEAWWAAVYGVARTRLKRLSSSGSRPWVEEPGRLQSMGSQRVGHDWATSLSLYTFMHWRGKWQPTPVLLPGESQEQGSLVGCRLWGRTE